jgi:hypothetical protein
MSPAASWSSAERTRPRSATHKGRAESGTRERGPGESPVVASAPAPNTGLLPRGAASATVLAGATCVLLLPRAAATSRESGMGASGRTCVSRSPPSRRSIVKNQSSPMANNSRNRTRFGCPRSANERNSRLNRASMDGSPCRSHLSATSVPRSLSWAAYTTPKPPDPRQLRTANRPDASRAVGRLNDTRGALTTLGGCASTRAAVRCGAGSAAGPQASLITKPSPQDPGQGLRGRDPGPSRNGLLRADQQVMRGAQQ